MKFTIACIALFVLGLGSIVYGAYSASEKEKTYKIRIFSDPETGCEYLVLENRGIVPRIDDRGGIICKEQSKRQRSL